jgi:RNA polymerase sigma factor (sigma-70 family)
VNKTIKQRIKLLLVDDHPIVLEGIKSHLSKQPEFEVLGEAANGADAVRQAKKLKPDIILMDISMPKMNGLEAMAALCRQLPLAKLLVLTMYDSEEYINQAVRQGARGYMLKDSAPSELVHAIKLIHEGQVYLSPAVSKVMLDELVKDRRKVKQNPALGTLSEREREVLLFIADGMSNKEMAQRLGVSVRTVETHRERIMRKLEIHTVAGLTKFAVARGLVKLE